MGSGVCIDFMNLNEACQKDNYPLLRIDQLVEAMAGHELLSFMDAYSSYNQIRMHPPDEDTTAFTMGQGLLQGDSFRTQKRRGHLPGDGEQGLQGPHRERHGGIYG